MATIAVSLPSFIVMGTIIHFLNKFKDSPYKDWFFTGIRPIVLGLIASAAVSVAMDAFIDIKSIVMSIIIFYIVSFKSLNPIYAIILAGITGIIFY